MEKLFSGKKFTVIVITLYFLTVCKFSQEPYNGKGKTGNGPQHNGEFFKIKTVMKEPDLLIKKIFGII